MYNIIYNPYAGRGNSRFSIETVVGIFYEKGVIYELHTTEYEGHATSIVNAIVNRSSGPHIFVVVGGDGTVFEVVNGLVRTDNVTVGVVPGGTGNDIVRMLNLSNDTLDAVNKILIGHTKKIDLGLINDKYRSLLFSSYGIVIDIIMACRKLKKKKRRNYILALFKGIFKYKAKNYVLMHSGKKMYYKADFISVQNATNVGGGMKVCHNAKIDDGLLNIVVIKYSGYIRRILNFISMLGDKLHEQPNVISHVVESAEIVSLNDSRCCVDGEVMNCDIISAVAKHKEIQFFC